MCYERGFNLKFGLSLGLERVHGGVLWLEMGLEGRETCEEGGYFVDECVEEHCVRLFSLVSASQRDSSRSHSSSPWVVTEGSEFVNAIFRNHRSTLSFLFLSRCLFCHWFKLYMYYMYM